MAFTDPQNNIDQFDLLSGMHVADLGAGIGAYAVVAAKKVGPDGKINAVEVQRDLLEKIRTTAESEHIFNIKPIWGNVEKLGGSSLGNSSMDAVIVSNILFQLENKENIIKETYRILKLNRKVLLVEWMDSAGGLGPVEDKVVYSDEAKKLFMDNGFDYEKDIYAGDNHYGMIFRKKGDEIQGSNIKI
ncbi:MAG: methyltransferase domain-containing protein [Candidatus Pacebacteria bacterium]|nr:methyltransferase domain-containing protein [Candidatus Paceibacterota bacterium]